MPYTVLMREQGMPALRMAVSLQPMTGTQFTHDTLSETPDMSPLAVRTLAVRASCCSLRAGLGTWQGSTFEP